MGLEVLVRPLVVPATKPTPGVPLDLADEQPVSLDGGSGRFIALSHSYSLSWTQRTEVEHRRTYDVLRIHNPDDDSQYVDDEVVTEMRTIDALGNIIKRKFIPPPEPGPGGNIIVLSKNNERTLIETKTNPAFAD